MADVPVSVEISGDGSEATRELKEVNKQLNKTEAGEKQVAKSTGILTRARTKLLAVTTALVAVELGRRFAAHVKAVDRFSQAVEISAERAQSLAFAAKKTGLGLGEVESAMLNLAREAGSRNNAFRLLGIDFRRLESMSPDDLFREIANQAEDGNLNAVQMAAAVKLLGSNGEQTFAALSNGFNQFAEDAQSSGAVIQGEVFEQIVNSAIELKGALIQAAEAVASTLLPGFTSFGEEAVKWLDRITDSVDTLLASMTFLKTAAEGIFSGKGIKASIDAATEAGRDRLGQLERQRGQRIGSRRTDQGAVSAVDVQTQLGKNEYVSDLVSQLGGRQPVDSLAKTGLFATAGSSAAQSIQARQVGLLTRIATNTGKTVQAVEKN